MNIRQIAKRGFYAYLRRLFSKSEYRFFLKSAVENVDQRVAAQLATTNIFGTIIRPIPLLPPFGKRVLALAPHQDDEAIGCGGTLLLQRRAGYPVHVAFVQSGAPNFGVGNDAARDRIIATREAEANAAADLGGFEKPHFLRHNTLSVSGIGPIADSISKLVNELNPDVIFSPFMIDPHADHTLTNLALALALKQNNHICRIMGYEVWSNCIANVGVAIDEVVEQKKALINCYKSQIQHTDYVHSTIGLNMHHSLTFGEPGFKYVEMFFDIPSKEFVEPMIKITKALWPEEELRPGT